MTETTLAALAKAFHGHEATCAAEAAKTRLAIEGLTATVGSLEKTVDAGLKWFAGVKKSAWRGVWAICLVLFTGFVSVVVTNINADITAREQAKVVAQTLAATTQATSARNKAEILNAIAAK